MKLNHKNIINNIISKFQNIRTKLFAVLCSTVAIIVVFLILINSIVLESYYIYSKEAVLLGAYKAINAYYNGTIGNSNIELELEKLSISNDFDILIRTNTSIYASSRDFYSSLTDEDYNVRRGLNENLLHSDDNVEIKKIFDKETELAFMLLSANLDNGYQLYIRVAIAPIQASAKIANRFLMLIGCITMIIGGMAVLIISRKFTSPIEELNEITSRISELDFSKKYKVIDSQDEFNNLR